MKIIVVALVVLAAACGSVDTAEQPQSADALCSAMQDLGASGLEASLSAPARIEDPQIAERQAEEAREALARFRDAAPPEIAEDAERVTARLEGFVTMLNDPASAPGEVLDWFSEGPDAQQALIDSAERVNAVTQERCGEPLVDPSALRQAG